MPSSASSFSCTSSSPSARRTSPAHAHTRKPSSSSSPHRLSPPGSDRPHGGHSGHGSHGGARKPTAANAKRQHLQRVAAATEVLQRCARRRAAWLKVAAAREDKVSGLSRHSAALSLPLPLLCNTCTGGGARSGRSDPSATALILLYCYEQAAGVIQAAAGARQRRRAQTAKRVRTRAVRRLQVRRPGG
jgi:hypothetical protein